MNPLWHKMQAQSYPIAVKELFSPDALPLSTLYSSGPNSREEFNVTNLAKMFMFASFVKSRTEAESTTVKDIVERELAQYPYTRRDIFQEPFFIPIDMNNNSLEFTSAVTDAGACQVWSSIDFIIMIVIPVVLS